MVEDTTCGCPECNLDNDAVGLGAIVDALAGLTATLLRCDGRCVFPQDLIEGYSSDVPAYPDPECSLHGEPDTTCGCPHHDPVCPNCHQPFRGSWHEPVFGACHVWNTPPEAHLAHLAVGP